LPSFFNGKALAWLELRLIIMSSSEMSSSGSPAFNDLSHPSILRMPSAASTLAGMIRGFLWTVRTAHPCHCNASLWSPRRPDTAYGIGLSCSPIKSLRRTDIAQFQFRRESRIPKSTPKRIIPVKEISGFAKMKPCKSCCRGALPTSKKDITTKNGTSRVEPGLISRAPFLDAPGLSTSD
jgi:hypothetical protein